MSSRELKQQQEHVPGKFIPTYLCFPCTIGRFRRIIQFELKSIKWPFIWLWLVGGGYRWDNSDYLLIYWTKCKIPQTLLRCNWKDDRDLAHVKEDPAASLIVPFEHEPTTLISALLLGDPWRRDGTRAVEDWLDAAAVKTSCGARSSPFGLTASHPRKVTPLPLSRWIVPCAILRLTTPDRRRHDQNKINYYGLIQCSSWRFTSDIGILLQVRVFPAFVTCQSIASAAIFRWRSFVITFQKTIPMKCWSSLIYDECNYFCERMVMFVCCIESVFKRDGKLYWKGSI